MKISKGYVIGIAVFILIIFAFFGVFMYQKNASRRAFAERIYSEGSSASPGGGVSAESVEKIKSAIATYEKRIERHVRDAASTSTYWKLLAVRLQDRGLHGEALEALERAVYYSPADPSLHYYTGVSAGVMAKSVHVYPGSDNSERNRYFALAEEAYLRAIELDSRYQRPRYGLSVLYVFELDRPEDAIPHLEQCLEISRNDVDVMFVLARANYMLKNYREAVALYDRIINLTKDDQKKLDAQNNRQMIMGQMYG